MKDPSGKTKISELTFILTDRCPWHCAYCYQRRGPKTIDEKTLDRACAALFPRLSSSPTIQFYGGEPLLAFDRIRRAVERLERLNRPSRKRLSYLLTTNGALLRPEALAFFNAHRFGLMLSFDGLAQDESRQKGSGRVLSAVLDALPGYPGIRPAVNSVFGPRTVGLLSKSVISIAERHIRNIHLSFDCRAAWGKVSLGRLSRELRAVRRFLLRRFSRPDRDGPLMNFRRPSSSSSRDGCPAARERLALAPDGRLWGCYLYADLFRVHPAAARPFGLGTADRFLRAGRALDRDVLARYASVWTDGSATSERPCFACSHVESCAFCPPAAAVISGKIGMIPLAYCRVNRVFTGERDLFWRKISEREA